ncbi:uncharacterized protein LOC110702258 [Chenopodium quinoa]|uniref:uncharacterized protein LOC110702258 n=1 Tax=Chenopodium quinoa TaxID=63459 RepID=UPI000B77E585|nr:uncharacterized protein LOC110702258 [Chenopodium quinoa]
MASNSTRKECFEREIFGLPSEYADFVMKVKNGMLLFLFDFQDRLLYGVFEATSDGAMNIVPDAYKSTSNRKFPAQVRFSTFWHCDPLPENIFGDAIKENYFKQFKFNLGLSRDQVGRLLFLFEKRMLRIPNSPVRERKNQSSRQIEKSMVLHPKSVVNLELLTETSQESIPKETGNMDAPDHGNATHLDDYIPLPSIEPEEIEDPSEGFLCGADLSSLWPFTKVGGTDGDKQVDDDTRCHVQGGWDLDYSKPASCSSGPKISIPQVEHKKIDDSSGFQVQGLYSDKMRTSAFLRLSGLGKVLGKERHRRSEVDNLGDVLKGLDERLKMWKCKSSIENASRISVFSRLRRDVGKAMEGETKSMYVAKEFNSQNLKHKSSCSVKISELDYDNLPGNQPGKALESHSKVVLSGEMKSVDIVKEFISQTLKRKISSNVETNEKGCDNLLGKQPGRRLRINCSRKRSRTRTYKFQQ